MKVLMVCLGNICRSPLAQGILEQKINQRKLDWHVDSAGTSSWHIGEPPDKRSIEKAREYSIDISGQRARQIQNSDLESFDLILTMDTSNYNKVLDLDIYNTNADKIKLILNYVYPDKNMAVPDPYYDNGFQKVYDLLNEAIDRVIEKHTSKN